MATTLALFGAAAPAHAVTILIHIVGPGRVVDTKYAGQINCTTPENTPNGTITDCAKDYNAFSGPILQPSIPAGWNGGQRFVGWDQPHTGEIDCDDEPLLQNICTFGTGVNSGTMYITARFIDTTAPQLNVAPSGPIGRVASTSATFSMSSPDNTARFECTIDGAAFAPCTSPVTYSGLSQGIHSFGVRAKDPSGNTSGVQSRGWAVDTVAPTATIGSGPSGIVSDAAATFTFSANEAGATFVCQLDAGPVSACSSPQSYANLANGAHTFRVSASDGLQTGAAATRPWTVDATLPKTTLLSSPAAIGAAMTTTFTFASSVAPAAFQCRLTGAGGHDWQSCASPRTYTALPEGSHTFSVRALNSAAAPDPSPPQSTFVIDRTAPDTTAGGDAGSGFTFAASEPGATYACSIDGAAPGACLSPFLPPAGLTAGGHTLDVTATDAAGNADPSPARVTWEVPPPPSIIDSPAIMPPPVVVSETPRIVITLSFFMRAGRDSTRFSRLSVVGVPAGAKVRVSCTGKRCPKKTFTSTRSGTVVLTPYRTTLRAGVKLTVLVTKPGTIGAAKTLTVRKGKAPLIATQCVAPGATKPSKC